MPWTKPRALMLDHGAQYRVPAKADQFPLR